MQVQKLSLPQPMGGLLRIEPTELKFLIGPKRSSSLVQVSNKTDHYVAFKVKTTNPRKYCVRPKAGVLLPGSTCNIVVTMQVLKEATPDMECRDRFLLQSVTVNDGMTAGDINPETFRKKAGHQIKEYKLKVVYVSSPQLSSPILGGPAEGSSRRGTALGIGNGSGFNTTSKPFSEQIESQLIASHANSKSKKVKQTSPESSANSSSCLASGDNVLLIESPTQEGQISGVVEGNLQKEIGASWQDKKDEDHHIPEGGGGYMDNQDHVIEEVESAIIRCEKLAGHSPVNTVKQWNDAGKRDSEVRMLSTASQAKSKCKKVKRRAPYRYTRNLSPPKKFKKENVEKWITCQASSDLLPIDTPAQERLFSNCVEVNLQKEDDASWQEKKDAESNTPAGGAFNMDNQDHAIKEVELPIITREECSGAVTEISSAVHRPDHVTQEVDMGVSGTSCGMLADVKPLSFNFEGHCPGDIVKQWNGTRKSDEENLLQSGINNFPLDKEPTENNWIPFVRTLPIWEGLESMGVFRVLPQQPHFHPLVKYYEESREGMAIGFMVVFASLVEKMSKLKADDPRSLFDRYLQTLADLEVLGFDVKAVVDRLHELLSIQERRGQLQDLSKEVQDQIAERIKEKAKLDEDIDAIDKKLCELKEKRANCISAKEVEESEITAWRLDADVTKEKVLSAEHEFETIAASSWSSA